MIDLRLNEDKFQENYSKTFLYQIKNNNFSLFLVFLYIQFNKKNKLKGDCIIWENINLKHFYTIIASIIPINYQQVEFLLILIMNISNVNIKLNDSHIALLNIDIGINIGSNELKIILLNDIMNISNKTYILYYKKNIFFVTTILIIYTLL